MREVPIEDWANRLEAAIGGDGAGPLCRVTVVRVTDSTQDAARRMSAKPGDVVVAWRQTAGRGRWGRRWADTLQQGIAVTIVTDTAPPHRLALAGAVGAAQAAEALLDRPVGIKWPNDIVVDRLKLAGVLVEQFDRKAFIGIGMNVSQTHWPAELADRAVSLSQLGAVVGRIDALETLLPTVRAALRFDDEQLIEAVSARDVLHGIHATFRTGQKTVRGTVLRIDPMQGLLVRTDGGEVYLPAATTTIITDRIEASP